MKATTLIFAIMLLCTGGLFAQTPDGQTPNIEEPCAFETGAAYGACTAYCSAMDCSSDSARASSQACQNHRDRFIQLTGRELPCELPCACLTLPVFVAGTEGPGIYCEYRVHSGTFVLITVNGITAGTTGGNPAPSHGGCGIFINDTTPIAAMNTTPEDGEKCNNYLRGLAADYGLTCRTRP